MSELEYILLPGLDGTGMLFDPLIRVIPSTRTARVVQYPDDCVLSYGQLLERITIQLDGSRSVVLLAESFSGPLALSYAAAHPERVRAVILVASFIRSPVPRWLRLLPWSFLFRLPLPQWIVGYALLDERSPPSLINAVIKACRQVAPKVLVGRLRQVCEVDCTRALAECQSPILYLQAQHDRLVGATCAREVLQIQPNATIISLSGPHLLLQTVPAPAWREIERFLNSILAPPN